MERVPEQEAQLVDLREFVGILRRRKMIVVATTLLVASLAVGLVARRTPVFSATSRVEVRPLTAEGAQYTTSSDLQSSMDTEAEKVTSSRIVAGAEASGAPAEADVTASVPANTTLIDVTCTELDPSVAMTCANAFAQAYVEDRRTLAQQTYDDAARAPNAALKAANEDITDLTSKIRGETDRDLRQEYLTELNDARQAKATATVQLYGIPSASGTPAMIALEATQPVFPSNKNFITTAILAFILGGALGIGLAFARERLDERVGGRSELEHDLRAPVLAMIPRTPGQRGSNATRLITLSAPKGGAAEAFRTARTTLMYLAHEGGLQVILITGPGQGDGKTTSTANLGVALAQSGKRVVAISCDLRRPRLHRYFNQTNDQGLSDVLTGQVDIPTALKKTSVPGLLMLPSGHVPPNPAELLGSGVMDDLLDELRKVADFVLLDSPPSLVVSDALGLAPKADGTLIVVDAATTHRAALSHLRTQLDRAGGNIIGSLLNNLNRQNSKYYDRYGGYYSAGEGYRDADEVAVFSGNGNRDLNVDAEEASTNGDGSRFRGNGEAPQQESRRSRRRKVRSRGAS